MRTRHLSTLRSVSLVLAVMAVLPRIALGQQSAIDRAVEFLLSSRDAQGVWLEGEKGKIATAEVANAFRELRADGRVELVGPLTLIGGDAATYDENSFASIAQKIMGLHSAGQSVGALRAALLSGQNASGGWGVSA